MHVQARAQPNLSPDDLAKFLRVLAENEGEGRDPINVEGVAGAGIETGGKFVFAVDNGREGDAHDRLTSKGYRCEWTTDLYHDEIPPRQGSNEATPAAPPDPNQPGILLAIVEAAKNSREGGRTIDTVLIGAFTKRPNRFFAQVTFEDSAWTEDRPGPHPED